MFHRGFRTGLVLLSSVVLAGCSSQSSDTRDVASAVSLKFDSISFVKGEGVYAGTETSLLSVDKSTGQRALLVKVPAGKKDGGSYHFHTSGSHCLVLDGSVTSTIGGKQVTLGRGDYCYVPANSIHLDSSTDGGALIFMVTEGEMNVVAAKPDARMDAVDTGWGQVTLRRHDEMKFAPGDGTWKGVDVAVLAKNAKSGAVAAMVKVPDNKADDRPHAHTASAFSIVLDGGVRSGVPGVEAFSLAPLDYHFQPKDVPCAGSHGVPGGGTIFMLTTGEFGTQFK